MSLALALLMSLPALGQENVSSRIAAIPSGSKIELRLNNKQVLRGTRGPLSATAFTLVDARAGERQIVFDEIASVKRLKSHTRRNVLIGVGIGVAALGITAGILLRCGPFGCGKPTI